MAALPPLAEPAPSVQPQQDADPGPRKAKRSLFQMRG